MARTKIDPAISRKANQMATKALREQHRPQFMALLDMAYTELGVESPRQRRERKTQEQANAVLLRKQKAAEKKAAQIAAARALLEAEGLSVFDGTEVNA